MASKNIKATTSPMPRVVRMDYNIPTGRRGRPKNYHCFLSVPVARGPLSGRIARLLEQHTPEGALNVRWQLV